MAQYNYTKTPVALDTLTQEIQKSAILIALDYITIFGAAVSIYFKDDLSSGDQSILDGIINLHTGISSNQPSIQQVFITTALPAFSAKTIAVNGVTKSLFKRFTGITQTINAGSNTFIWTQSMYDWTKFMGMQVIGGEIGDRCDFIVLDTATGTYTGVPNYPLNQFAFSANIAKDFYSHKSEYDADMWKNLQIKFVYSSISAKTIYINFDMNEVR